MNNFPLTAEETLMSGRAAILAYPGKDETNTDWRKNIIPRAEHYGFFEVETASSSGVDAWYGYFDETRLCFVVAIRGTSGIFDTLLDLFAIPKKTQVGNAHYGFYHAAKFLWKDLGIKRRINEAIARGATIIVTGHSLGAAIAIELAGLAALPGEPVEVDAVLALCAPRSSTKTRAEFISDAYGSRIMRVTYSRDLVCMVPPPIFFRHVGDTLYFDCQDGLHTKLTTFYRIYDVARSMVYDSLKGQFFRRMLGFHSAKAVVNLIEQNSQFLPLKVSDGTQAPENESPEVSD